MANTFVVTVLALLASAMAEPLLWGGLYGSPLSTYPTYPASLAYSAPLVAAPPTMAAQAAVPTLPTLSGYPIPYSMNSYGYSVSVNEVPYVSPSANLVVSPAYNGLPYAYDYVYRR